MRLWYRKNIVVFLKKANSSKINLTSDEIILSKVSNFVLVLLMIRATKNCNTCQILSMLIVVCFISTLVRSLKVIKLNKKL